MPAPITTVAARSFTAIVSRPRVAPTTPRLRSRQRSSRRVLVRGDPPAVEAQQHPFEASLRVLASGVEAQRPAELQPARRLVDVTVERGERLVPLDRLANG